MKELYVEMTLEVKEVNEACPMPEAIGFLRSHHISIDNNSRHLHGIYTIFRRDHQDDPSL